MSSKTSTAVSAIACPPGTMSGGPIRTRFFDGMFLTQADLETEQRYWRIKRRLTNRALGEGVVWGLRLEWKANKRSFSLSPGYALDCCGNDLVVECPVEVSESQLWTRADPSLKGNDQVVVSPAPVIVEVSPEEIHAREHDTTHACVVLQYVECAEGARPVHRDACAGPTGHCEPSRIRESTRLLLVPPPTKLPLTPPEQFLKELQEWRDGLPSDVQAVLFPPGGTPPSTAVTGDLPLMLSVSVGGSPTNVQVPATGSSAPVSLNGTQTPDPNRLSGVVTFELLPSTNWHLVAGRVTDAGRTVETVTPPASPSMYWSLDITIPDVPNEPRNIEFQFELDQIELKEMFGASGSASVTASVRGAAIVELLASGGGVQVTIDDLIIETKSSELTDVEGDEGCLRELIPWGWTVDPANGGKIARVLVLASLYGAMVEVLRRGASAQMRALFGLLYGMAWYVLFRVNPVAGSPATEAHRLKLAEMLVKLYERWCAGFVYPGPRCSDEHHGIYLGCATLSRSGQIQSFDMWKHRRHVLTGPLLNHWAGQFGIAPLDVIVGRFASAICCLSGLPAIGLPAMGNNNGPENGVGFDLNGPGGKAVHFGTVASVTTFASDFNVEPRWVGPTEVAMKMPAALASVNHAGSFDVFATQLKEGNSIAVAVPQGSSQKPQAGNELVKVNEDVYGMLSHGEHRVREAGRAAVAEFTGLLLKKATARSLVGEQDSAATRKVAEVAEHEGMSVADLADAGTDAVVKRTHVSGAEGREGAATLVDAAELTVEKVVATTVKVLGRNVDRAAFANRDNVEKLTQQLGKVLPRLDGGTVEAVAKQVSKGS